MPQSPIPVVFAPPSYGHPGIVPSADQTVSSLTWAASVVTAVAAAALPAPLAVGDVFAVNVTGETPSGYDGQYLATVTAADTFTYALASDPGAETVQGTFTVLDKATAVVKAAAGVLASVVVTATGTVGVLTINNCKTLAEATASNEVFSIAFGSVTVGQVIDLDFPCDTGIVVSAMPAGGNFSITNS